MSLKDRFEAEKEIGEAGEFDEVLSNFRRSIHAWSAAEFNRPRRAVEPAGGRVWRLAAGWALGCVLVAAGVSGGFVHQHRVTEMTEMRITHARIIEQQRQAAEKQRQEARQAELLANADSELAKVDSEISRQVPSAMEPLAQLMAEDESK